MVAKMHQDRLKDLKEKVENWQEYFKDNNDRYHDFINMVFNTSLTPEECAKLKKLGKPPLEFNILESFVSNLRGEFSNQTPTINVSPDDTLDPAWLTESYFKMIDVIEGYLRDTIANPKNDGLQDKFYRDTLAGGFSVARVYTDYVSNLSFEQQIHVERAYDPTMCGFDPLAKLSHKGDGSYCFELYPMTREDFEHNYGKNVSSKISFTRVANGFNWSYSNGVQKIVLVCDLYEKVRKKIKIVKLSNGHVVAKKHYQDLLDMWESQGFIEQPPVIIKERMSEVEVVDRYRFCEGGVIDHTPTNYGMLPLIFIDGNSMTIKSKASGVSKQMTRPYVWNAASIQKLKNLAGQTIGAEIEDMIQHKIKVAIEAIPEDYIDAYTNIQEARVLAYNAFFDGDPSVRLDPPQEIQRAATPSIVESTFAGTDKTTEIILGSYTTTMATNEKNISGVAIANGSIHTSAASDPYLGGYINGLNRIAEVVLDLIPKYYVTPRTLPVVTYDGKREYRTINRQDDPQSIRLNYRPHDLNVCVEAGVNNTLQKAQALDKITSLMSASESFAAFMNTKGIDVLVENLDIDGADALKQRAEQFMAQLEEQQAQAAQQPDPQQVAIENMTEVEMAKIQQRREQAQGELSVKSAEVATDNKKVDIQFMEALSNIEKNNAKIALDQERVDAENAKTAVESLMSTTEAMDDLMKMEEVNEKEGR